MELCFLQVYDAHFTTFSTSMPSYYPTNCPPTVFSTYVVVNLPFAFCLFLYLIYIDFLFVCSCWDKHSIQNTVSIFWKPLPKPYDVISVKLHWQMPAAAFDVCVYNTLLVSTVCVYKKNAFLVSVKLQLVKVNLLLCS